MEGLWFYPWPGPGDCTLGQGTVSLGWVKYTIGNTPNHKVKQINIKVISKCYGA